DASAVDRVPYMAPGLQTPERALRGKLPTDVWWNSIVGTNSRERTGYPTQKPLAIIRRVIGASSRPGDLVVDWCAGSGTAGVAAAELGRRWLLVDESPAAVDAMRQRLSSRASLGRLRSRAHRGPGDLRGHRLRQGRVHPARGARLRRHGARPLRTHRAGHRLRRARG
ncbi:MAG: site-specific DNA-methyltransferase, partial [Chloroflexi bacterium]